MSDDTTNGSSMGKLPSFMTFDFSTLMDQYKIQGVDTAALMDRQRKNIEAFTEANRLAYDGWRALIRRQTEIFEKTMTATLEKVQSGDAVKGRSELASQGFEKAVSDMRQLAEMAAESQKKALEVLNKNLEENLSFRKI